MERVKRVTYNYVWKTEEVEQTFRLELEKAINDECSMGWIPWNLDEQSAFNTAYTECHYYYAVWYRR